MTSETFNASTEASISNAELAELCASRAATYRFLARLFLKEVDEQLLADLKGMRFPANTGSELMDAGYRGIVGYLAGTWEATLQDLAVDYTRTFIGSGVDSFSAAYPLESVYTSEKRLTMQNSRDEVLAVYRAYGIEKSSSWKEGEDHAACELEFLGHLSEMAAKAFAAGKGEQGLSLLLASRNFLNDHLGLWMPMLTFGMKKFSKTSFYAGLSDLMRGFVELDREFLDDICADGE